MLRGILSSIAFALLIFAVDCSSVGSDCQTDSDCDSGQSCIYPIADGCKAKGKCEAPSGTPCRSIAEYCGCDGSIVYVGGCSFSGAPAPVQSGFAGDCGHGDQDAGALASSPDAG